MCSCCACGKIACMAHKVNIPVISDATMDEIIYGMENQDSDYFFCIEDGNVYSSNDDLADFFDNPDEMSFEQLPMWTSSDGFKLMCSYAQSCKDSKLQKQLIDVLNSKQRGVFRRFKEILATKEGATDSWYKFKDNRMASVVRSWYKDLMTRYENTPVEHELSDDHCIGALMVTYEIEHMETLENRAREMVDAVVANDALSKKVLSAFNKLEAFCAYKDGVLCGLVAFEVMDNVAVVPIYNIEEKSRGLGLFELLFDLMNRDLERRNVKKVQFLLKAGSKMENFLASRGVMSSSIYDIREYAVENWNETVDSQEMAYLV